MNRKQIQEIFREKSWMSLLLSSPFIHFNRHSYLSDVAIGPSFKFQVVNTFRPHSSLSSHCIQRQWSEIVSIPNQIQFQLNFWSSPASIVVERLLMTILEPSLRFSFITKVFNYLVAQGVKLCRRTFVGGWRGSALHMFFRYDFKA